MTTICKDGPLGKEVSSELNTLSGGNNWPHNLLRCTRCAKKMLLSPNFYFSMHWLTTHVQPTWVLHICVVLLIEFHEINGMRSRLWINCKHFCLIYDMDSLLSYGNVVGAV